MYILTQKLGSYSNFDLETSTFEKNIELNDLVF